MDITKLFCEKTPFRLAKQGEYGQEYSFDYSTWLAEFGAGTLTWAFQGPSDSAARVLESTEDDGVSTIVLTADETASAGSGSMEVFFVDNGETQKRISATIQFYIEPSLVIGGSGGGDFKLAEVTFLNSASGKYYSLLITLYDPELQAIYRPPVNDVGDGATVYLPIPTNGAGYVLTPYDFDLVDWSATAVVTGAITEEEGVFYVKGDGTITLKGDGVA